MTDNLQSNEPLDIYERIQFLVKKDISDAITAQEKQSQFQVTKIPAHQHTGVDSQQIDFSDLTGIPIITALPTDSPQNGIVRLYDDGAARKFVQFINGAWYYVNLTAL